MEPKKAADKFVRQAGVLVRDQIPIIIEYWNKPKKGDGTFVDERSKETLWNSLLVNFTLPPEEDENKPVIKEKVKEWTLNKMVRRFSQLEDKIEQICQSS